MKRLLLLRHGKSSWDDEGLDDHDRPLIERGEQAARRVGHHLVERGITLDVMVTSTAKRAADTACLLRGVLPLPPDIQQDPGLYMCGTTAMLARIRCLSDDAGTAMIIAHNPDLQSLARQLLRSGDPDRLWKIAEKFPTCACAVITFQIESWTDVGPRGGHLEELILPRELSCLR